MNAELFYINKKWLSVNIYLRAYLDVEIPVTIAQQPENVTNSPSRAATANGGGPAFAVENAP